MEVVEQPGQTWSSEFRCPRCGTLFRVDEGDLRVDGFKVSGYHFAGTAVCVDKFYVSCPSDSVDILVEDVERIPVLLRDRLQGELAARRRERGY